MNDDLLAALPLPVRNKARAAGAADWLAGLPSLVDGLQRDWAIALGRVYPDATEAFVAEATMDDGTAAVLKVMVPQAVDATRHEATVLRLAGGHGCARLLREDLGRGALLLERLGRPLSELNLPALERQRILCATASRLWRPAPGSDLPTGAEKGRWLIDFITRTYEELDHPCSERAIADALAAAARRIVAHDDERAVLVHGDVHQWNALQTPDGTAFKLVDPDGLLAEAEYDLGVLLREDPLELLDGDPHERAHRLATETGLDATAIWEWGVVERVSTGLLCTKIELQPVGRDMLRAADAVAQTGATKMQNRWPAGSA